LYIQKKGNESLFLREKEFNVTGSCNPQRHYMVDISRKFDAVMSLIGKGKYFTINRPRQYGKTTMLNMLAQSFWKQPDKHVLIRLSFEGIGDDIFNSEKVFVPELLDLISSKIKDLYPALSAYASNACNHTKSFKELSAFINSFIQEAGRDVILFIDEVDKSSNNQLFLNFLGMLRDKYIDRDAGAGATFHSVVLAGVHDVKSLKLKIRKDGETKLNSPWNIAADFNVDMGFNPPEIKTMLVSYAGDNGVEMDFDAVAERIYYYTNGYPFLVSKICKNIAEEAAGQNPDYDSRHWTTADIDWSFRWLTRESYTTTNFDDLVKNLDNNPELYNLVNAILFNGSDKSISFSVKNPLVNQGIMYGMFKEEDGRTVIHNRVYEQILSDYIRSKQETAKPEQGFNGYALGYIDNSGALQLKNTLLKFQEFMKEPVAGDERRMDIVVTYGNRQKEVIELKIWRGEEYHQQGLEQFSGYLDFQNLKHGYLLIFDFNKKKKYKTETIKYKDKEIFAVWV
jgi:hypothetical protein